MRPLTVRWLDALRVGYLGAVFVVALGCDGRKPESGNPAADKAARPENGPQAPAPNKEGQVPSGDAAVKAEVVAKEVRDDPIAAETKYTGQTIVVEGPVSDLFRRPNDGSGSSGVVVAVSLVGVPTPTEPNGTSVFCECRPEDEKKASELSIGQVVRIRGRCAEAALAPRSCVIESVGPDPSIKVDATELVTEFLKNQKAAEAKYKGKPLTLTAAVIERKDGSDLVLTYGPNKAITVGASRPDRAIDQKQFDAAKPGDRVTIKCRFGGAALFGIRFEKCRLVP
jgi:hypothetical protein